LVLIIILVYIVRAASTTRHTSRLSELCTCGCALYRHYARNAAQCIDRCNLHRKARASRRLALG